MGFKVYQSQEVDANLLSAQGKSKVYAVESGTFQVMPPQPVKGKKPVFQDADEVVAYINVSTTGRQIIVVWDSPAGASPPVASPRTQPTTVATSPGQWLVTPDIDNLDNQRIDGAVQSKVPTGWKAGPKISFTTSMCGLDAFVVTYRFIQSGAPRLEHVIIRVRKRIQVHLFEMKRRPKAKDDETFDEYRAPLAEAQKFLADNFGIDLIFKDNKILPEGTTEFASNRSTNQVSKMIKAANAASRNPTDLWINVVNAISGNVTGWGGQSMASVEVKDIVESRTDREKWLDNWHAYENSKKNQISVLPQAWVKDSFHPPLVGDERELAIKLADKRVTPQGLFQREMLNILLHEIGHTLGLVPTNQMAGGTGQGGWVDTSHKFHCSTQSCIMFFEGETAQLGVTFRIGEQKPFDHDMVNPEQCTLFLKACDLSDLRKLPQ